MIKLNEPARRNKQAAEYLRKLADQVESDNHLIIDINLSQTVENRRGSCFEPDIARLSVDFSITVMEDESTSALTGIYNEVAHG